MMGETIVARQKFPYEELVSRILNRGEKVDTGHWQAIKNVPHTRTVELQYIRLDMPIKPTAGSWAAFCQPNLPWAEEHFAERVSGVSHNPSPSHVRWPWYDPSWAAQKGEERKFSHTYEERIWPRWANQPVEGLYSHDRDSTQQGRQGVRYRYGDLNDLGDLLFREPYTRQAYLPIWFPEDTGAHHGERVPCTLGYHFMLRDDKLHCFYPMRSVDLVRYLRDDAYMAGRLVQWILDRLVDREVETNPAAHAEHGGFWSGGDASPGIVPGNLVMLCSSLHVFEDEIPALRRKHAPNS